MKGVTLAIVGFGKWGYNHVNTAAKLLDHSAITVCDTDEAGRDKLKKISGNINFTTDLSEVIADESINAVIIATPAETHFEIAKKMMEAGKNVLVEKPITLISGEAEELLKIANDKGVILMVGHVLLYHPAVLKIKEMLEEGKLGKLQYIYSNRLNLGTIRSEENILWSFAPHDISVIQFLTDNNPTEVFARGASFLQHQIEDTTLTFMKYPDNVSAHIFVSWLHPFKEQRLVVIGDKGMVVFEDSLPAEKLKYYKKGFQRVEGVLEKFDHDYEVIEFDNKMPLEEEQKHFFECVADGKQPLTDGQHAIEVLKILEESEKSLR
ncbi:MAG: Gfo/Idh/MocA family oxidoreductase [Ignavibacteriae bacterium]|nr:Gfo/Idh/MocA family oxidoreductase [Ignavibacteriota bacterium]MCB9244022.1 Gfo/Idh/MocA family oxidoreductase [Ignavibacteriales bacterium]